MCNPIGQSLLNLNKDIEIYNSDSLDLIIGKFVYRHGKRNALPDNAHLLKHNWFFNCAYRYS